MNDKKILIYLTCLFLPLIALSAPKDRAPSDSISECMAISAPGAYTLSQDLPGSSGYLSDGSCLLIEANAISIDLEGHTITGLGSGYGVTDNGAAYQNTKISNGNISGFVTGISLAGSSLSAVENVHVTANLQDGIVLGATSTMLQNVAVGNTRGLVIQCPGNALGNSAWGNSESDLFKIDPSLCSLSEGLNSLGTTGDDCTGCDGVGLTDCSGTCTNLVTDEANCGSCGYSCGSGYACLDGTCTVSCLPGLIAVAGTCVNPNTDEQYCGATSSDPGTSCGPGEICTAGFCAVSCPSGQLECYGLCSDLLTDEANCGICGNTCAPGQYCVDGSCQVFGG